MPGSRTTRSSRHFLLRTTKVVEVIATPISGGNINMATSAQTWSEEIVEAAGGAVQLVKGGQGDPLLILHDELGHPGWLNYHQALAQNNTLYIPSHSGFGETERQEWIMNMRDLAGWYLEVLDDLGLDKVNLMGISLGGWLAAEMASMSPQTFNKMILVGPAGIKPPTGEIYDMFLVVAKIFITQGFYDPAGTPEFATICPDEPTPEQIELWEVAREEASRMSWRPYMHYPGLPHLLHRIKTLPTLVVWGKEDTIVPLSAGQVYQESIKGSRLAVIDNCGHHPEIEKTEEFLGLVKEFLAA
jgi:pimeloyl-ACP methyl ester carboxylesterase